MPQWRARGGGGARGSLPRRIRVGVWADLSLSLPLSLPLRMPVTQTHLEREPASSAVSRKLPRTSRTPGGALAAPKTCETMASTREVEGQGVTSARSGRNSMPTAPQPVHSRSSVRLRVIGSVRGGSPACCATPHISCPSPHLGTSTRAEPQGLEGGHNNIRRQLDGFG